MRRHQARRLALLAGLGGLAVLVAAVSRTYLEQQRLTSGPVTTPANMSPAGGGAVAAIPDFATLVHQSDLVVVGRVVGEGITRQEVQPVRTPIPFQPDPGLANLPANKRAGLKDAAPAGARSNAGVITPPAGIPVTQFTVEVTQVLNGKVAKGQHVVINQFGGTYQMALGPGLPTLSRTVVSEHDPLLVKGEEQVFFLSNGSDSGTFDVTGGPDGRFKVDARGLLQPVDQGSPVGQAHKGETVDSIAKQVNILRQGGNVNSQGQ